MEEVVGKSRLRSLLEHFSEIKDCRDPAKVRYPLAEVLLLVVAATIADCDDYDEIALWGKSHLNFLRTFLEYHFGTPKEDWLRVLMNRIDPALFQECFTVWALELRPDATDLIAIDGKTSRRSHDRSRGQKPLHLVSAFATTQRLVLAQEAIDEKENECGAIPDILDRIDIEGALVTIDAIACNPKIAAAITERKGDYILAVKANQPTILNEIAIFFEDPASKIAFCSDTDKDHGRIETRRVAVSHEVGWLLSDRRYPDEPRFPTLAAIVMVESTIETKGTVTTERRYYIFSAKLTPQRAAEAIRGHWRIENSLHWVLDVIFKEDQSRLRRGHGARNMAIVRHFAINLVRIGKGKHSIKTTRKAAGWDTQTLARILNPTPR